MTETWLPVVGFEGFYEVSDTGRVRGVDRYIRSYSMNGVVFAEHLDQLSELSTKVFAELDGDVPLHWLCDEPVWESMVQWFGDPRFETPEFTW